MFIRIENELINLDHTCKVETFIKAVSYTNADDEHKTAKVTAISFGDCGTYYKTTSVFVEDDEPLDDVEWFPFDATDAINTITDGLEKHLNVVVLAEYTKDCNVIRKQAYHRERRLKRELL